MKPTGRRYGDGTRELFDPMPLMDALAVLIVLLLIVLLTSAETASLRGRLAQAQQAETTEAPQPIATITFDAQGQVRVDEQPIALDALIDTLSERRRGLDADAAETRTVRIEGADNAPYGVSLRVRAACHAAEVTAYEVYEEQTP